jgi:hypothetical protein
MIRLLSGAEVTAIDLIDFYGIPLTPSPNSGEGEPEHKI